MKKASDLYSLTRRELILLEMFNMLDDEEQVQRLCSLSGYLLGRKIISEDDSMKYLREIKKTDSLFQLPVSWVYRYKTSLYILLRIFSLCILPTNSMIVSLYFKGTPPLSDVHNSTHFHDCGNIEAHFHNYGNIEPHPPHHAVVCYNITICNRNQTGR